MLECLFWDALEENTVYWNVHDIKPVVMPGTDEEHRTVGRQEKSVDTLVK